MIYMLVDISSHLQATEGGMQEMRVERAAARTQNPSTTHANHGLMVGQTELVPIINLPPRSWTSPRL